MIPQGSYRLARPNHCVQEQGIQQNIGTLSLLAAMCVTPKEAVMVIGAVSFSMGTWL
jgi:hypothetical protein